MVAPFKNEPFTDFKDPKQRSAFEDALARVAAEAGRAHASVIDGERTKGDLVLETRNPSDPDRVLSRFPAATKEEAERAVLAADAAFPAWADTPWADRAHLLFETADRLRRDKHYFSAWMVVE